MARDVSFLPGDLLKRIDKIDKAIERDSKGILSAIAAAGKEEHQHVLSADAGGDLVLGRVRSGRGAKIGATYRLERSETSWNATMRATGPVPLLANPIKPHAIPKQRGGRRRFIVIPGVGVRASAQHPGTKGKDSWRRGRERAEPRMTRIAQERTDKTVKQAFLSGG